MAQNIDPQLLQQLLALAQGQDVGQWSGTGDLADWTVDRRRDVLSSNPNAGDTYSDPITRLYRNTGHETWGQDTADVYDAQGNSIGGSSGDSEALSMAKFLAMALGGYYGTSALNGMMAPAAGTSAASGLTASEAAMLMGDGATAGLGSGAGVGGAAAGGGVAAGGAGSAAGGAGTAGAVKSVVDALGGGGGVAALVGGAAGALDGGDKEQSTSRDPWAPAQDFLKQQLAQGQQLSQQYQAQPFSQAQQTAYGNFGGLLDLANANAGSLLSGYQANASGANQFQRGRPGLLQGSTYNSAQQWLPGLLGNFGTSKG